MKLHVPAHCAFAFGEYLAGGFAGSGGEDDQYRVRQLVEAANAAKD